MLLFYFILLSIAAGAIMHLCGVRVPNGVLLATLTPVTRANCRTRAGLKRIHFIDFADIDQATVVLGVNEEFTAHTEVATKTWAKFDFEPGTANLVQEKQVNGSSLNWTQTINMTFGNDNAADRLAFKLLDQECDLVAYCTLNNGTTKIVGMRGEASGTSSESLGLATAPSTFDSGANPNGDSATRIVSLSCFSEDEAQHTTVSESALAV